MRFSKNKHSVDLYNILLTFSRNKFFYTKVKLPDTFETRIYLMFLHFSIIMIIFKKKGKKFNQDLYDLLFNYIENDLRELGFGDVSVNKKMKELNKILYDILLKLQDNSEIDSFKVNKSLICKYFKQFDMTKNGVYIEFETYLLNFFNFCFEKPIDNMLEEIIKFKN